MRTLALLLGAAVCCCATLCAQAADLPPLGAFFEAFRNSYNRAMSAERARQVEALRQRKMVQDLVPEDKPFPCDVRLGRSPTPPDSVHRLRPGDIDVVAAMGDGLSAGNGALATNLARVFVQNKGLSWNIGGEGTWRQFLTLPNILKEFNPQLVGFSPNDSFAHHKASQFNVADVLAESRDLPGQARLLVRRMRAHPRVDFNRHWKLVTMFMGANDFCFELCVGDTANRAVENHRRDLLVTLDYLRKNLPRTLVSIVVAANLEFVTKFTSRPPECAQIAPWLCPCLFRRYQQARQPEFAEVMRQWQQVEVDVAADVRYAGLSDFAVVSQPFSKNITFPTTSLGLTDYSFLSPDCLHIIQKTHAREMEWNRQGLYALITAYSKERCLYDPLDSLYHNKNSKKESLERVAATVQAVLPLATTIDCKNRFASLRSHYSHELKKIRASERSGAGTENVYKPGVWWFPYMVFLRDHVQPRHAINNIPSAVLPQPTPSTSHVDHLEVHITEEPAFVELNSTENTVDYSQDIQLENDDELSLIYTPQRPKPKVQHHTSSNKRKRAIEDLEDDTLNVLKDIHSAMSSGSTEDDKLGQYVAAELKKMTNKKFKSATKIKIMQAIMDGIQMHMDE